MDGWMDGWMDAWMDGWMHVWLDGCMDTLSHLDASKLLQQCTCCLLAHKHSLTSSARILVSRAELMLTLGDFFNFV